MSAIDELSRKFESGNDVPVEPTEEELVKFATDEQFLLFCDDEEFVQIARAVLSAFGQKTDAAAPKPVQHPAQLRFKSACEISGPKHPEYVKGYEAAMAVKAKEQPWQVPAGHTYLPIITPEMWEEFGDTDVMTWIDGPQWTQIAVDFASMLPVKMPAQPAPIPTSERLPTEADADCDGRVFVWMHASRGKCWLMTHWLNARHGDYWLPTGLHKPADTEGGAE